MSLHIRNEAGEAWLSIRKRILERDPYCLACLRNDVYTPSDSVDHIVPQAMGGTHEDDNLRGYCRYHNSVRGGHQKRGHHLRASDAMPRAKRSRW